MFHVEGQHEPPPELEEEAPELEALPDEELEADPELEPDEELPEPLELDALVESSPPSPGF